MKVLVKLVITKIWEGDYQLDGLPLSFRSETSQHNENMLAL